MKRNLLLDIDGVLCDFHKSFAGYLNNKYNKNLDLFQDPGNYDFTLWSTETIDIPAQEAMDGWIKEGGFINAPIYNGAVGFYNTLQELANVTIVTARLGDIHSSGVIHLKEKVVDDTHKWFKKCGLFVKSDIIFDGDKVNYCSNNGITIMIEDKLTTVLKASQEGIHAILINRGWNQHPPRHRVYRSISYDDALNWVKRLSK